LETTVNEAIKWLNASPEGSKEEYEEKQKELKGVAKYALPSSAGPYFYLPQTYPPFFFLALSCKKLYGGALGGFPGGAPGGFPGGAPGGFPGAGEEGPTVEEVTKLLSFLVLHFAFAHASSYELT
jgi:L1 cell adhesion molecule like protein